MAIDFSDAFALDREQMVEGQLRRRGIRDERVLDAMLRVPRHFFVPEEFQSRAYADYPIPIEEDQTISQPFIVALSLQALELTGSECVLEIGTGSGYQTALLSVLARMVYSVERHASLARQAAAILQNLGVNNMEVVVGDGTRGLPDFAPFDAILVSAAAPSIPQSLFQQLSLGGRMVVPVGPPQAQELQLIRRRDGKAVIEVLEACRFVPLIGTEGY